MAINLMVPVELKEPVEVEVKRGMNFSDVAAMLDGRGVINDGRIVTIIVRIAHLDRVVKSGFYSFSGLVSPYRVIADLISGRVMESEVTIPEGFNIWQIAERLSDAGILEEDEFLAFAEDRDLLEKLGIDGPSIEGYLYPDTYRFPLGLSPGDVIGRMVLMMRSQLEKAGRSGGEWKDLNELKVLTIASIIEKEARADEERALISAVFHNRLRRGMMLQADPTALYGVKDHSGTVTLNDLRRDSPYNTYSVKGLPPGPIASPGFKSIVAALFPADVPYLFFVSSGDGRHHFSEKESEHRRAVRRYRSSR